MIKKMMMSFFICLLIPICIIIYFVLYKDLREKGLPFFHKEDIAVLEGEVQANEKEEELLYPEEEAVAFEEIEEQMDVAVADEPLDDINTNDEEEKPSKKFDQFTHKSTEDGVLVHFVTKDEDGKVIDERYETLNNEQIIEQNSDRHLEILAEEFVRMHFESKRHDVFYSGEIKSRDGQYAKVDVIKMEWKENFYKEKYNVILDISGAVAKPISMQKVKI